MTDRELLELLLEKMGNMEVQIGGVKSDIESINRKITKIEDTQNAIFEQTAFLTEYKTESEMKVTDLYKKVENNTTDINLIKKLLA